MLNSTVYLMLILLIKTFIYNCYFDQLCTFFFLEYTAHFTYFYPIYSFSNKATCSNMGQIRQCLYSYNLLTRFVIVINLFDLLLDVKPLNLLIHLNSLFNLFLVYLTLIECNFIPIFSLYFPLVFLILLLNFLRRL